MIRSEWHGGPRLDAPKGLTTPPFPQQTDPQLPSNRYWDQITDAWSKAVEIKGSTAPGDMVVPPCLALQLPLAYKYPSYSHQPIGAINWSWHLVEDHKWLEASGVEVGVGLLLIPQRVRYHFSHPHPGYFISLDSLVGKSQVISLFALRFLNCSLSSFYLSLLLCSSVG
jgi:hypothetical protein